MKLTVAVRALLFMVWGSLIRLLSIYRFAVLSICATERACPVCR